MKLSRKQTALALTIAALFFGFTLFQASWLAPDPVGRPKLVGDHAAEPVRDAAGCVASANSGFGGSNVGPDVAALQAAAGSGASAIRITTILADGNLRIAPQFDSSCTADKARPHATLAEVQSGLTKPEIFWQVEGEAAARQLVAELPTPSLGVSERNVIIGDEAAVGYVIARAAGHRAFSIAKARQCTSDYRLSGLWGRVPESCRNGTMLLTLDDIGFTLWGWPNRFLARMKDADVRLIIAEDVNSGRIKGLTNVNQYGDIARSYNGYIWVDNIEELGPALRR